MRLKFLLRITPADEVNSVLLAYFLRSRMTMHIIRAELFVVRLISRFAEMLFETSAPNHIIYHHQ